MVCELVCESDSFAIVRSLRSNSLSQLFGKFVDPFVVKEVEGLERNGGFGALPGGGSGVGGVEETEEFLLPDSGGHEVDRTVVMLEGLLVGFVLREVFFAELGEGVSAGVFEIEESGGSKG